ncbi:glycosyltransferase family 4 protein [Actinoplanes awajinensis]|uniref:Glycosyl transferase family 1 n=1 Tax=Actinoplanes awajinensis subsp. mycoplanecinus TaxID=135947 RepID=A0A0X3UYM5_9ACTN|nr:glycosyltransferase family 1 protein [Actinoplanes awajinensis]KUL37619.1 glycosyl transferase family 1 [Actinoplanes awajinensis subsp. mycoplanecinus]
MRIALVTESFLPDVNGVAHSVVRTAEHLVRTGHEPIVIAPEPAPGPAPITMPYPVVRVPSVPLPGYPQIRLGLPVPALRSAIRSHGAEVVHLASPFVLGAWARTAAASLGLPTVAIYQTDVAAYARARQLGVCEQLSWRWIRRLHNGASRTLAPSTESMTALREHGVERVHLWRRGVDDVRFQPSRRSAGVRRALCRDGEVLVGFVGRLAVEKEVDLLAGVAALPGVRLVVIGDGPARGMLRRALPTATFLGARHGSQLARIYASLDVFAHTGPFETFGQTVQEAMASGVPVVAPAKGGPCDLVRDGLTGFLVPPHEAAGFTRAVARLAADPMLRRAMGQAGRSAIAGRSWAAVGDQLLGHYAEVLGGAFPAVPEMSRPQAAAA